MISEDIQHLIEQVKTLPNSLERNKTTSHLEDARVWAKQLENKFSHAPHPADQCTCPAGAVDAKCPVHA